MQDKTKISNLSVPVKYELMPFNDDRFKKCKILVMHDGLNLNGSVFNKDAIENAKESIKNIPILAFVRQNDGTDGADFGGHESEVILGDDGVKFRYLGRPIGIIPSDACDYHYEIYDDKTYVAVTGYIWTDYANEALDILEKSGEKGQSMEIRIDDGNWDDNDFFNITSYRYTGLTILGDNVHPAMTGAKVQLFSVDDNKTFSDEYFTMVDELNKALKDYASQSKESEDSDMPEDDKELDKDFENQDDAEGEKGTKENLETNSVDGDENTPAGEEGNADKTPETEEKEPEVDYSAQILQLNTELSNLQTSYGVLEAEVIELREYKRIAEEEKARVQAEAEYAKKQEIFADFAIGLTDEEMKPVKDKENELSVKEITDSLNAIFTAKNLAQLKAKKFTNDAKGVVIDVPKKDNGKSKYAI